jgi:plasmid stabilization system protein ParE
MRARFTDPASFELERSISYFVEHAPASATAFADSIDATVARLVENPYSSQETEMPGIRRAYIRRFRYSIFYTVEGDEVVILHIQHAARRWPWQGKR